MVCECSNVNVLHRKVTTFILLTTSILQKIVCLNKTELVRPEKVSTLPQTLDSANQLGMMKNFMCVQCSYKN